MMTPGPHPINAHPVIPSRTFHPRLFRPTACRPAKLAAWATISSFARFAPSASRRRSLSQLVDPHQGSAVKYITAGVGAASWARIASWLRKFEFFTAEMAAASGRATIPAKMFRHNGLALEFLVRVADEGKGRTRVAAAIRALNFVR